MAGCLTLIGRLFTFEKVLFSGFAEWAMPGSPQLSDVELRGV